MRINHKVWAGLTEFSANSDLSVGMSEPTIASEVQARAILGLAPDAPLAAWRPAFASVMKEIHPDLGGQSSDARLVIEAYKFLKSTETERQTARAAVTRKQNAAERALSVVISISEAFSGCERVIDRGDGVNVTVRLPGGLHPGQKIPLPGHERVELHIRVRPEEDAELRGRDLWLRRRIKRSEWAEHRRLQVATPSGNVQISLSPEQVASGVIKIRGDGLPDPDGDAPGDLYLVLAQAPGQRPSAWRKEAGRKEAGRKEAERWPAAANCA